MPDPYGVEWTPSARRDLAKLPEKIAAAVVEFIYGGLADNPQRVGRDLHLELTGLHSARRGDFGHLPDRRSASPRCRHSDRPSSGRLPTPVTERGHDNCWHPAPLLAGRRGPSAPLRQPYTTVTATTPGERGAVGGADLSG